ncbi:MAG: HEAT repeat domain-containing protein [Synechococcales cyanobacterium]
MAEPSTLTLAQQLHRLQHGDDGERYYAAWWLGFPGAREAVPALIAALQDEQDKTAAGGFPLRRNAAQALGKIGDPQAIPALIHALADGDPYVVAKAALALGTLALPHPEQHRLVEEALLQWLRHSPVFSPTDPLEAVMETLGRLGCRRAVPELLPLIEHDHPRLASAACRALFLLTGDPAYVERLLLGLTHDNIHVRRGVLFDLAATGYVPAAAAVANAALETNLKLLALKTLADEHLRRHPTDTTAIRPLLTCLDHLL